MDMNDHLREGSTIGVGQDTTATFRAVSDLEPFCCLEHIGRCWSQQREGRQTETSERERERFFCGEMLTLFFVYFFYDGQL